MSRISTIIAVALVSIAACGDHEDAASLEMQTQLSSRPGFVFPDICCFHDDERVRTVVPPAAFPNEGRDAFYTFAGATAEGQLGVVAVAPGDAGYHGGQWMVYAVTFVDGVSPYLLTSEDAVLEAEAAGDVTITRQSESDFLCPIQK